MGVVVKMHFIMAFRKKLAFEGQAGSRKKAREIDVLVKDIIKFSQNLAFQTDNYTPNTTKFI